MSKDSERVWDGRGDRLCDARFYWGSGRAADDLRLTGIHMRLLLHLGRQHQRRGWVLVSQSEIAERWSVSRQSINLAIKELVDWGYLSKQSQAESGESFCLYRLLLNEDDGEELAP